MAFPGKPGLIRKYLPAANCTSGKALGEGQTPR